MNGRPNILVLMCDQLRFDGLGYAGNARINTPNIDRLAASGVRFSQACCPTPVCVPSRLSFITGLRLRQHRLPTNEPLPGAQPALPTMMDLLHDAGWHCHGVGKMHFRGRMYGFQELQRMEETPEHRIDDDYLMYLAAQGVRTRHPQGLRDLLYYQPQTSGIPREHSQSAWVAREAQRFLREHRRHRPDTPFFLTASWIAPHPPFAPCEPYDDMYDPDDMPLPVYPERPVASLPSAGGMRGRLDGAHLDAERIRRIRALYYGQVSQVDEGIGAILDSLDELGLSDDTVVVFLSYHGDMLGDHGLAQKNVPYEASVRIPLILRWPGRTKAGRTCVDLVGIEDVLPTLIDELGLQRDSAAPPLPGRSLLGRVGGGLAEDRPWYPIDYGAGAERWLALRSRERLYARWARGGFEELYDLAHDPEQRHNRADSDPEREAWRRTATEWERAHGLEAEGEPLPVHAWSPPADECPRCVSINEGRWPENLPADEADGVESYAAAFTRAIAKERLQPEDLSLARYKAAGGHSLAGTPWEAAWRQA